MRSWPCDPGGAVHKALPASVYGGFCQEAHPGPEFDGAGLALPLPPTGDLMEDHQPHLETFQAALDGLDVLLAQEVHPR